MTAPAPADPDLDPAPATRATVDTLAGDRLVRFDRAERWLHWVNATLVLVLIATGSIMYIGALSGLVGRRLLVRDIHLWSGLALPVPFLAVVVGRWGHGFRRDCARLGRFLTDDWRWLNRRQRRYGELRVGKFNLAARGQPADRDVGRHLGPGQVRAACDDLERRVEARGVARGEQLLGVGGTAGAAHLDGDPDVDVEEPVVGGGVAVAALTRGGGVRGVQRLHVDDHIVHN